MFYDCWQAKSDYKLQLVYCIIKYLVIIKYTLFNIYNIYIICRLVFFSLEKYRKIQIIANEQYICAYDCRTKKNTTVKIPL